MLILLLLITEPVDCGGETGHGEYRDDRVQLFDLRVETLHTALFGRVVN